MVTSLLTRYFISKWCWIFMRDNIVYFCVPSRCTYSVHVQNHVHHFCIGCDSLFPSLSILQTAVKWDLKKQEVGIAHAGSDGTRRRTGGEVKGKDANGVGSQSSCIHTPHFSAASSWLNWPPRRLKWTRPFRRKTNSGFCACAVTFRVGFNTGMNDVRTGNLEV